MILKGSQRAGAADLAGHLMNDRDNDHVEVLEISGFVADDLHGTLQEAYAISKATQCTQYLFSLSLSPPEDHVATEQEFLDAVDRAEAALGLTGQPRAIIIHEKEGRRHAHAVWSRIDGDTIKAINLPHYKRKLNSLAKELFLDHGWDLPDGLKTPGGKSPLNFTLAEWQQAKRMGMDAREIKATLRQAWEQSDGLPALTHALEERGYYLAQGDRRGFVVLDVHGAVYSLPRWLGERTKTVSAKLGQSDELPSVTERRSNLRSKINAQLLGFIDETKTRHAQETAPLQHERAKMIAHHRNERSAMHKGQEQRWIAEAKARSERLNTGIRGLWDKVTGASKAAQRANDTDAYQAFKRDQAQRDALVMAQMHERQLLQTRFKQLRSKHADERQSMARDIHDYLSHGRLDALGKTQEPPKEKQMERGVAPARRFKSYKDKQAQSPRPRWPDISR